MKDITKMLAVAEKVIQAMKIALEATEKEQPKKRKSHGGKK
jgi:hypothetical protein